MKRFLIACLLLLAGGCTSPDSTTLVVGQCYQLRHVFRDPYEEPFVMEFRILSIRSGYVQYQLSDGTTKSNSLDMIEADSKPIHCNYENPTRLHQ